MNRYNFQSNFFNQITLELRQASFEGKDNLINFAWPTVEKFVDFAIVREESLNKRAKRISYILEVDIVLSE